jgi:pheromone shutdown protein TraB
MFHLLAAISNVPAVTFSLNGGVIVQLLLTIIMPIVVAFVTQRTTSSAAKAWLLAGLTLVSSILTGIGSAIAAGTPFDIGVALLLAFPQFAISAATYHGLWKPTGIAQKVQDIEATTIVK